MDIIVPRTKKKFFQVDSQLGAVLVELGLVEKLERPAAPSPYPPAGFAVATIIRGNRVRPHIVRHDGFGGCCFWDAPPQECPREVATHWKSLVTRYDAQRRADLQQAERTGCGGGGY